MKVGQGFACGGGGMMRQRAHLLGVEAWPLAVLLALSLECLPLSEVNPACGVEPVLVGLKETLNRCYHRIAWVRAVAVLKRYVGYTRARKVVYLSAEVGVSVHGVEPCANFRYELNRYFLTPSCSIV